MKVLAKKKSFLAIILVVMLFVCNLSSCVFLSFSGQIAFYVDGVLYASSYTDGYEIVFPNEPEKDGKSFDGWYFYNSSIELTNDSLYEMAVPEDGIYQVVAHWC